MKKLISMLLVLALLCSVALVSCNTGSGDDEGTTTTTTTTTTTKKQESNTPDNEGGDNLGGGDNEGGDNLGGGDNEGEGEGSGEGEDSQTNAVEIADAAALADFAAKINDGTLAADTNAKLTADIDMTGYSDTDKWNPMYVYSGIFDGAGHKITNLNWSFVMENSANGDMNMATDAGTYVVVNTENAAVNSFADAGIALLVICLDGGEIKDLTLENSSVSITCTYNKNYNTAIAGLVAYADGGKITDCTTANVTVTVPANVNYNQGPKGYAALFVGRATGDVEITGCSAGGTVDTTANVKFNAAPIMGEYFGEGSVKIASCTSSATISVCTNLTTSVLAWKGNLSDAELLGGVAGEIYAASTVTVES